MHETILVLSRDILLYRCTFKICDLLSHAKVSCVLFVEFGGIRKDFAHSVATHAFLTQVHTQWCCFPRRSCKHAIPTSPTAASAADSICSHVLCHLCYNVPNSWTQSQPSHFSRTYFTFQRWGGRRCRVRSGQWGSGVQPSLEHDLAPRTTAE